MDYAKESLRLHYEWKGKLEITPKMPLDSREALSLAYTPGVAQPCLEIQKDVEKSFELTGRANTVAVVTDGSAVLGLGDIGPEAGMPVMEGKCALFKAFGGVDAVPLCIRSKSVDEIVRTIALISGSFGGINLEDISAPRCFEIEARLKEILDIPVFHDDQHGTAVVVLAALKNALKLVEKPIGGVKIALSGAGSAGIAIAKLLLQAGAKNLILYDKNGALHKGGGYMNEAQREIANLTNPDGIKGGLDEIMKRADVFIGVSAPSIVRPEMIRAMAARPVVFPMANPTPEIMPEDALAAGAFVVGTGRSDYPNQINNVLAFPGIFRGALDARAKAITEEMKCAAADAIAALVGDLELSRDYILPQAFDPRVGKAVSEAVRAAALGE